MKITIFLLFLYFILSHPIAWAEQQSLTYYEMNLFHGFSEREGFFGMGNDSAKSIGVENFRKFSGEYGDWLTTNIQLRLAYNSDNTILDKTIGTGDPEADAL